MLKLDDMNPYAENIVATRRDIHAHPELGFDLPRTALLVETRLREYGYEVMTELAPCGVVGVMTFGSGGKTIALRADMDALPMQDEIGKPYVSQNPGIAHTCGHDAHTAMLLGAAKFIADHRNGLCGTLKLLFQPSEEGEPEPGAPYFVKSGIAADCDSIWGFHVDPSDPTGTVGLKRGILYASSARFDVEIIGVGGHAAYPEYTSDPIVTAAQIINALQTIVSRDIPPTESCVVSICSIEAGKTYNVIPNTVKFSGTFRALSTEFMETCRKRILELINGICLLNNCSAKIDIKVLSPVLTNDNELINIVSDVAGKIVGSKNVLIKSCSEMACDDFAFYNSVAKCSYFTLGVGNRQKGITEYVHNPKFDLDEDALPIGSSILAGIIQTLLGNQK